MREESLRRVISAFVSVLALLFGSLAVPADSRATDELPTHIVLRFDGMYQSEKIDEDYYYYLRFYDDGSVIAVSSTGTPAEIREWFNRKHEDISRGSYVITGTRIVFSAESKDGKVDYDGSLKGEKIEFRTYSHINKYRGDEKFTFVKPCEKDK